MNGKVIKLELPGFGKKTVDFSHSFVERAERRIYYKDIIGLSYHSVKQSVNFIPMTQSYYFVIQSSNERIDINFSSSVLNNKKKETLFTQLIYIAENIIKPHLFLNLLNQLKNETNISIGSITITTDGLYKKRFLRDPEFLPLQDYELCKIEEGRMTVYRKDYEKEDYYRQFCSIPLSEMNAVILPEIAQYLKENKGVVLRKEKGKFNADFCANCGAKIKKETNFCTQCGKKI